MQKIEAIIRPERLDAVKGALEAKGFVSMTLTSVDGRGLQKGTELEWRAGKYKVEFLPKLKIEIICNNDQSDEIVNTIIENAQTGEIGDGKIFIYNVEEAIRIRTGEKGPSTVEVKKV